MSRSVGGRQRDEAAAFGPLTAPRSLTGALVERLTQQIVSGRLAPGARLPTEQEMTAAMGVSRTVVREAVAALRAEGLVTTRQGVGAFVAADANRRPFRIAQEELPTIREAINVMELRCGVEIEAAGLAAERADAAAVERIGTAFTALQSAVEEDELAVDQDFAFHRAIAEATGNPQFSRFLEYLGRFIIPRQSVRYVSPRRESRRAYLDRIQEEHRAIYHAIRAGEVTAARTAMRRHLVNSRERYSKLANEMGE